MMKKKIVIESIIAIGLLISIYIVVKHFINEEMQQQSAEQVSMIKINTNYLENYYKEEGKYLPFFFQSYMTIKNEYKDYMNGAQNLNKLQKDIMILSKSFHTQFNKIEDVRLHQRFKLTKEDVASKSFNNLYHYSFQSRSRLKSYIDFIKENDQLSKDKIQKMYTNEIIKGFEKEFPLLLDILKKDKDQFPINSNADSKVSNDNSNQMIELKKDIALKLNAHHLIIKEIQVVGNDAYSYFVVVKIAIEEGEEQQLIKLAKNIYHDLFTLNPPITYLSINIETQKGDSLLTGIGNDVFKKSTNIKKVADLYKYSRSLSSHN